MPEPTSVPVTVQYSQFRGASDFSRTAAILDRKFADPEIGKKIERLVMEYPSVPRDLVAGLAVSGLISMDQGLLDATIRQSEKAVQNSSWWYQPWNWMKYTTRHGFLAAEDLYNVSPIHLIPRTLINHGQGAGWGDAFDMSLNSALGTQTSLDKLGIKSDFGQGFIPTYEDFQPGPDYWGRIKELVQSKQFAGSPDEQLLKAVNQARIEQIKNQGVSNMGLTSAMWRSTHLHKTLDDGTVAQVPYSPGAGAAIIFTTPGTRAYDTASAMVDSVARLVFEPVDVLADRALKAYKTSRLIGGDQALARNAAGELSEDAVQRIVKALEDEAEIVARKGPMDDPFQVAESGYKLNDRGLNRIEVSIREAMSHFKRVGARGDWDPANVYHRAFIDMGLSPDDVYRAVMKHGGDEASLMLTIEHELVHAEIQNLWHPTWVDDAGQEWVDLRRLSDAAPDEIRTLYNTADENAAGVMRNLREKVGEGFEEFFDDVSVYDTTEIGSVQKRLTERIKALQDEMLVPGKTAEEMKALREARARTVYALDQWRPAKLQIESLAEALSSTYEQVVETAAEGRAFRNMVDGTWSGPRIMELMRQNAGITKKGVRKNVNIKTFFEWVNTARGQRLMERFANEFDTIEKVRKHAPGLDPQDWRRIAESTDVGEITEMFRRAYADAPKQKPKTGGFKDPIGRGLDAWESSTQFGGAAMLVSSARRLARRAGAEAGHNMLAVGNARENLLAIANAGNTVGLDLNVIDDLQKKVLLMGDTQTGLRRVYEELRDAIVEKARLHGDEAEVAFQTEQILKQWGDATEMNHIYAVNPTTGRARQLWWNGKRYVANMEGPVLQTQHGAMLEAQFASSTIGIPNVRQLRRMSSGQRWVYEGARRAIWKAVKDTEKYPYLALGLQSSTPMRAADLAFGVWRDFALFRVGWALRILPEEHLRMGAMGYSNMFRHPMDYFSMMTNNMDFILPGDDITLAAVLQKDGLGAAMLRDLKTGDVFDAAKADWTVVNIGQNPELGWAGMTRDYLIIHNDRIGRYIAEHGPDAARQYFRTEEGKQILREVASQAKKGDTLEKIATPRILNEYIDVVELKIAEMSGGSGIYKEITPDHPKGVWFGSDGRRRYAFSDTSPEAFPNKKRLADFIENKTGQRPLTRLNRKELEQAAAVAAKYDIDALEAQRKVVHVVDHGNADFRQLIHQGTLDDIEFVEDMTFDQVRALDNKVRLAYENRGIEMSGFHVQVPKDELVRKARGTNFYNRAMDGFFRGFNAVPSAKLNRSPHFAQAFGRNVAISYVYSPAEVRKVIDDYAAANPAFKEIFDSGVKRALDELGLDELPPVRSLEPPDPATVANVTPEGIIEPPMSAYDTEPARYLKVEIGDGSSWTTPAFWEVMNDLGLLELRRGQRRGIQAYGQAGVLENNLLTFHGSSKYQTQLTRLMGEERMLQKLLDQGTDTFGVIDDTRRAELLARLDEIERERVAFHLGQRMADDPSLAFEPKTGGGISWDATRPSGYTGMGAPHQNVVLIFDPRDLPPSMRSYMEIVGDAEQHEALSKWGLDHIEGLEDEWNAVAQRSYIEIENRLVGDMLGVLDDDQARLLNEALDWIEQRARSRFNTETGMATDVLDHTPSELKTLMLDEIEHHIDWLTAPPHVEDALRHYASEGGWDARRKLGYIMERYTDGRGFHAGTSIPFTESGFVEHFARKFSLPDIEAEKVRSLYQHRSGRPAEIVVSQGGVRPIAVLQHDMFEKLVSEGVMPRSEHAIGDAAMFLDTYFEPVPVAWRESDRFTGMPLGEILSRTEKDRFRAFMESVIDHEPGTPKRGLFQDLETPAGYPTLNDFETGLQEFIEHQSAAYTRGLTSNHPDGEILSYNYAELYASPDLRNFIGSLYEAMWNHYPLPGLARRPSIPMSVEEFNHLTFVYYDRVVGDAWYAWTDAYGHPFPSVDDMTHHILGIDDFDAPLTQAQIDEAFYKFRDTVFNDIHNIEVGIDSIRQNFTGQIGKIRPKGAMPEMPLTWRVGLEKWQNRLHDFGTIDEAIETYPHLVDEIDALYEKVRTYSQENHGTSKYLNFQRENLTLTQLENMIDEAVDQATTLRQVILDHDFSQVPQAQRADAVQRFFNVENYRARWGETGGPRKVFGKAYQGTDAEKQLADQLENILQGSKYAAIEETKDLFYDLATKSNTADASRLLFPFGDAWYEVLSRWAKIMNPRYSGSQPYRNVRRLQTAMAAGRQSGFLSTNEFGEEVMNWPGLAGLAPIGDGQPFGLNSQMPMSSLMFIDPTARGIAGPSMSPLVQLSARMAQPTLDKMPALRSLVNWAAYGGADAFQPGRPTSVMDAATTFMPTPIRRMLAIITEESNREVYGNTKMRIFEAMLTSGDPRYQSWDPEGMRKAWEVAQTAGTWLSIARLFDSFFMPGQPQYQPTIVKDINPKAPGGQQVLSLISMSNEYRHARELWGESEAALYMVERYGVNPVVLQGMSSGVVQRPATWDYVNYAAANPWLEEVSPYTAGFAVPIGEEVYSHRAWQDQFTDRVMIDGVEGPTIREKNDPATIMQRIQRSQGYEMLRYQDAMLEKQIEQLRLTYGRGWENDPEYQIKKDQLMRIHRNNRAIIMTQFPPVESENSGAVVGERQSVTTNHLLKEIEDIGTPGTKANDAYREHEPALAQVAETFTRWFRTLETISMGRENQTGSPVWWQRAESPEAKEYMRMLIEDSEAYIESLTDPHARDYATFIVTRIIDPLAKDWEWIGQEFAPELELYPTLPTGIDF